MTPTPEQQEIVSAAKSLTDNLLVNALAGAAKTSTLKLVARALPDLQMLYLAFNKKIAVEMQEDLPVNCRAMTLNALGHRVWGDAIGRRLKIDTSKNYELMRKHIETLSQSEKSEAFETFSETLRWVAFGKQCGYVPTGTFDRAHPLMGDEDFFDHIEAKLTEQERWLIRQTTIDSITEAQRGWCDYDDQIFMPTIFFGAFPRYPLVLVDEAQDLSALNHAMLRKLAKKRLIAVGDPCQAIYGFRGAHEDSMDCLRQEFSMRELTLSVSFRCPSAIVKHCHWRAPNMRWPDWAREGTIGHLSEWHTDDLPEAAAILCRNNAPLFNLAIKLLKNGRHAEIGGSDIVKSLLAVMRKFGGSDLSQAQVLDAIDRWAEEKKAKTKKRGHDSIDDRAECMRIFTRQGQNLGDACAYAQHLTQLHSPLKMMTIHKAKGLEFDHVFLLDDHLIGQDDQEPNLRYVAITRTRDSLTYIKSENFRENA